MLNRCLSFLRRPFLAATVLLACVLAGPALAQPIQADFNGDQYSDVAIGAVQDLTGGSWGGRSEIEVGTVTVMYGSASGLVNPPKCAPKGGVPPVAPCSQLWDLGVPGLVGLGYNGGGGEFGFSLAAGDFNADGFADLAAGEPFGGGDGTNPRVAVLYGSSHGLGVPGNQEWSLNSPGIIGDPSGTPAFGFSLAVGDFNHDGFGDLTIGAVNENDGLPNGRGAVHVLYGSASGLSSSGNERWTKPKQFFNSPGEEFGSVLAVGDFNGDGASDLAIRDDNAVNPGNADGAVHFLYGSVVGLNLSNPRFFDDGSPGIDDGGLPAYQFGVGLSSSDFNADGYVDLAIGALGNDGSRVNVLYGSGFGLDSVGSQVWHQGLPGVRGDPEWLEAFGLAMAAGDFDGDGFSDLAIGDSTEEIGVAYNAGAVNVFLGSGTGLTSLNNGFWHQDSLGILDAAEDGDFFGNSLAAGDFDGDGRADLVVGVYEEDVAPGVLNSGAVNVLRGTSGQPRGDPPGLTAWGNQFLHQDSPGVPGAADYHDNFGFSVASGLPSRP